MVETMHSSNDVGLPASQVGILRGLAYQLVNAAENAIVKMI
jgi:peptide deformylase